MCISKSLCIVECEKYRKYSTDGMEKYYFYLYTVTAFNNDNPGRKGDCLAESEKMKNKANGRIRTDNPWFTKPELYR